MFRHVLFYFLTAGFIASAFGQGASREDRSEVQGSLQPLAATPRAEARPAVVDLRYALPAVGSQTMNDCVGWAYAYAARTYLEAVDQGWKPDDPQRIFSPTFVYNQINNGADKGSSPIKAVELLRDQGVATQRSMPYLANNHTFDPLRIGRAVQEAATFRIADFRIVTDGERMREALAAGEIICIGVRTNPAFSSGRYGLYTPELHAQGQAARRPDQPHGYHAMVVAGYDDHKRAFLLMNSWGQDWGQGGYVWVSYDVADTFNLNRSEEHLIDYAIVMTDVLQPVIDEGNLYVPLDTDEIRIDTRHRLRETTASGDPRYDLILNMVGPKGWAGSVAHIAWSYQDENGQPQVFETSSTRAIVSSGPGSQTLAAKVRLDDGRVYQREAAVELPAAFAHEVRLRRIDAFSHYDSEAEAQRYQREVQGHFRATFVPMMSALDWAALERIEWRESHHSMRTHGVVRSGLQEFPAYTVNYDPDRPIAIYQHNGGGEPDVARPTMAYPSAVFGKVPRGTATFVFKGGAEIEVPFPSEPFPEAPKRFQNYHESTFASVTRPVGTISGEAWHYFEVRVLFPERWGPLFVDGTFRFDGFTAPRINDDRPGWLTEGLEPLALVYHGYARDSFKVRGTVRLRHGAPSGVFEAPLPRLKPEQLLAKRRGEAELAAFGEIDLSGEFSGFRFQDQYLGRDETGTPRWRVKPWFDDWRQQGMWLDIEDFTRWQLDDPALSIESEFTPDFPEPFPVITTSGPFTLRAEGEFRRGTSSGLPTTTTESRSIDITPRTPATEGLALRAIAEAPARLRTEPSIDPAELMQIELVGSVTEQATVRRIDALIPQTSGWVYPLPIQIHELGRVSSEIARTVLPRPPAGQPQRAILTHSDGATRALETLPVQALPYPDTPMLLLEAVSHYWGTENGVPHWQVDLRLGGRVDEFSTIAEVDFSATTEAGESMEVTATGLRTAIVTTAVPLRVRAEVTFHDNRPSESYTAVALTPAESVLPDGIFKIGYQHLKTVRPYLGNFRNDQLMPMPVSHDAFFVQAPRRDLNRVQTVRYAIPKQFASPNDPPEIVEINRGRRQAPGEPDAPGTFLVEVERLDSPDWGLLGQSARATLVLDNGEEVELAEVTMPEGSTDNSYRLAPQLQVDVIPLSREPARIASIFRSEHPLDQQADIVGWELKFDPTSGVTLPESLNWPYGWIAAETAAPLIPHEVAIRTLKRNGDFALRTRKFDRRNGVQTAPAVVWRPNDVRVVSIPGGHRIVPDFQGDYFTAVAELWHEVTRGAETIRVIPLAWKGPGHERYAVTLLGAKPDAVITFYRDAAGAVHQLGSWQK